MFHGRITISCALAVMLGGCNSSSDRAPAIGEAYAGPSNLSLRQELAVASPVAATVHHGDRLEILQSRRRFIKVRTKQGVEGWTEANQLLTPAQMTELRRTSDDWAGLPSQGAATVYEALNIHTEPNRQSRSFYQIPEGGSVQVIGHKLAPRVAAASPSSTPVAYLQPRRVARRSKSKNAESRLLKPLPPPPPPPPANWVQLSKQIPVGEAASKQELTPTVSTPLEDWSQVRTKDGKAGWVLSRNLNMSIPDAVAQYAEGRRITSYFSLGDVRDGDQIKHNWLWTTKAKSPKPYEFDSFRVFIWNVRRHRYETVYVERNLVGYYPVEAHPAEGNHPPRFSLITEDKTGAIYKRTYEFEGYRVRVTNKVPCERPKVVEAGQIAQMKLSSPAAAPAEALSWTARAKQTLHAWKIRLFK